MAKKVERSFKYQRRSKDDLKTRANMKGGDYDSVFKPKFKQWKPKEGKNLIRILPPTWDNATHYGLDIFINYSIGADKQAYLSLSKHDKGRDPIAEARNDAQKEGEKKLADALRPSHRILYWVIDRNDEDEGPLLWAAPFGFDKSLSNLCIDEDTKEVIFIDDPEKGRDVRFYREGTGLNTTYEASKMKVLGESTLHEDEGIEAEWLDFIAENPLTEVLNFYDYEHIKAVFDGQVAPDEDDDDAEDEKSSRRRSRVSEDEDEKPARGRTRARPSADSDDDEDEEKPIKRRASKVADDGDDDDDDEPEEKPARTRQRAKPRDDDGDEDEDEKPVRGKASRKPVDEPDDDDDEEDEKPVRGRQHVASRKHDPEDDEDERPTKSRRGKTEDEDEGGSLRDRLARRRSRSSDDD